MDIRTLHYRLASGAIDLAKAMAQHRAGQVLQQAQAGEQQAGTVKAGTNESD